MNKTMFFITNDYKKIFIQKPEILNGPVDGYPLMWSKIYESENGFSFFFDASFV